MEEHTKSKIVLIQPAIGYMDDQRDQPSPPLGLLSIVSLLWKDYEIIIIDQRIHKRWKQEISRVAKDQPLLFAFSVFTGPPILNAITICQHIRRVSNAPIVWGGVHPSLLPTQTLENPCVDYVIQGEGEYAFLKLVLAIKNNEADLDHINGLWYKNEAGVVCQSASAESINMDTLPELPYHLLPISKYQPQFDGIRYFSIQTSRGCCHSCIYCYNQVYNDGVYREQSIETVLFRLQNIYRTHHVQGFYFVDDNFFLNKEKVFAVAKCLGELDIFWIVQGADIISLSTYSTQDFQYLYNNGLRRLTIGVESGSHRIRKLLKKKGRRKDIIAVMDKLKDIPIKVYCSYITNFPSETIKDLWLSVKLIMKLSKLNKHILFSPFYKYTPFPKTPLYDDMLRKKLFVSPKNLEAWGHYFYESKDSHVFADFLKKKGFWEGLFITSLLFDDKVFSFSKNLFLKPIAFFYTPIAKLRLSTLTFSYGIDLFFFKKVLGRIFVGR